MASNICQRLINKRWKSYVNGLAEAPQSEGIYAIGLQLVPAGVETIYVGRSIHIHQRLQEHKWQNQQEIDKFVKGQFSRLTGGTNLFVKWVEVKNSKCLEGNYLDCMCSQLGYWPHYNLRRGNTCIKSR